MRMRSLTMTVVSLSLVCSLVPAGGMALAAGELPAADEAIAVVSAQEGDNATSNGDGGVTSTVTSAVSDAGTASSDERDASQVAEQGTSAEVTADVASSAGAPASEVSSSDDGAASSEGEQKAASESPSLLSDEELDALAVELDSSDILEASEGDIALRAQAIEGWQRVWGQEALDTMQRVLQMGPFPAGRGGDVIVATADGYWDALSASGLAGTLHAPIVLTSTHELSSQSSAELARLRPNRILVMGGTSVITDHVYSQLQAFAPTVTRIWGQEADDTAVAAFRAGTGWGKTAIIATCLGYWDALSAAPYSYWSSSPIFLTKKDKTLSDSTLAAIRDGGFSRVIITGGTSVVSSSVEGQLSGAGIGNVSRVWGEIALDTSAEVAKFAVSEGMKLTYLTVATSDGYWDALSAAPVCGENESVLVLVSSGGDYRALDAIYTYAPDSVQRGYIIGGTSVIPEKVEQRVTANWALKNVNVSPSSIRAGGTVTMTPELVMGGASASDFAYNYHWTGGGTSGASGFSKDATSYTLTLTAPGSYEVAVEASGPDGSKQTVSKNVAVYGLNGLNVSANNRHSWHLTADLGLSGSGASGVEFRFTWNRNGSDASGVIRDWSSSPTADVDVKQMQGSAHTYTVTVEARDQQGSLGTRSANITPSHALDIEWAGQPNNYYCGPTAGFMILRNAGAWSSRADGSSLTIGNVAAAMGTSYYGYTSFTDRMFERGMNAWLGGDVYMTIDNPSYDTVRDAIFRSFDTGYAVAFDAHEVSGGWHYNGHNDATFSHILVVDAYNPDNDTVLLVDPGAGVLWGGASQKFWYSLRDFVNIYLAPAYWRDGIGMICPR